MATVVRASATEWQSRTAAWRTSAQTAAAFALEHGYTVGTLRWWSSRLRRRAAVRLVPLAPGHGDAVGRSPVVDAGIRAVPLTRAAHFAGVLVASLESDERLVRLLDP